MSSDPDVKSQEVDYVLDMGGRRGACVNLVPGCVRARHFGLNIANNNMDSDMMR
jgi:hypothetical protein